MTENCECCSEQTGSALTAVPEQISSGNIGKCPLNGQRGKAVPNQTLKALLKISLRVVDEQDSYYFCPDSTCPVVYFNANGSQTFEVDQLREQVYQKEQANEAVLVCYCFQHTLGAIRQAGKAQRQAILDDIKAGIAQDQCACDLRNPQGTCCLGNVSKLIKQLDSASTV